MSNSESKDTKFIPKGKPKSVLIVENIRKIVFLLKSMGFINKLEEKNIVENVNRLINLEILDDMYM